MEATFKWCGEETGPIFYGKTDIKSAFRIVPLSPKCYRWLFLKAEDPETKITYYFADKNLPFGASISCSLFQDFSEALRHITEFRTRRPASITNYLDDFLFVSTTVRHCNFMIHEFIRICQEIGVPIANKKTVWGCEIITFLGIVLNGKFRRFEIPEEKRLRALNLLQNVSEKRSAKVEILERLSGFLNFLNKAIFPGRAFTRRMYAKFTGIIEGKTNLRKFHHVRLDEEFKQDCKMWIQFLDSNHISTVYRPFLDVKNLDSAFPITMYSDAAKAEGLGFGCLMDTSYTYGKWNKNFLREKNPSINYLELYAVCIGVFTWSSWLRNLRFILFCDNSSVVDMINSTTSGSAECMELVRILTIRSLKLNCRIYAKHVEGKDNNICDSLSRLDAKRFYVLKAKYGLDDKATHPSEQVWPEEKVWKDFRKH